MRLLNTKTIELEEFFDASIPPYAILSHTWEEGEVLFRDMADRVRAMTKPGWEKIRDACVLADIQGHRYIWIDTCCIDKSSSAELSEAINSMYRYYRESVVCYAYLCDVNDDAQIASSRWFTRGWTLQELIAPRRLELYSASWDYIGGRNDPDLLPVISSASLVDEYVLSGAVAPNAVSVAKRMYWASSRTTTRKEDEAYCLMGLFDVNMPLLYGEGEKAFARLQQEITKITDDQSIFAWYGFWRGGEFGYTGPLKTSCCAPSPKCFALSGGITPLHDMSVTRLLGHIDLTAAYSEFTAVVAEETKHAKQRTIILNCQIGPIPGTFPTITLCEWQNTRHYIREMVPNRVTQTSLHGGPDRFSGKYRVGPIGIEVDPSETMVVRIAPDGSRRRFPVKRVKTWETVSSLIDNTPVVNPPLVTMTVCYRIFWLVPSVPTATHGDITISVLDAFPSQRWDRRSNQFIWGPEPSRWGRDAGEPITVGVARIRLQLPGGIVMGQESQHAITAVVSFGMLRPANCSPIRYPLWCSLAQDDGGLTLEQHFASRPVIGDTTDCASLLIDEGIVLHASAAPTDMSKCKYDMISLWATQEGAGESEAAVTGEKPAAEHLSGTMVTDTWQNLSDQTIRAPLPSWSLTNQRRSS